MKMNDRNGNDKKMSFEAHHHQISSDVKRADLQIHVDGASGVRVSDT
jgi:hypothetical protein